MSDGMAIIAEYARANLNRVLDEKAAALRGAEPEPSAFIAPEMRDNLATVAKAVERNAALRIATPEERDAILKAEAEGMERSAAEKRARGEDPQAWALESAYQKAHAEAARVEQDKMAAALGPDDLYVSPYATPLQGDPGDENDAPSYRARNMGNGACDDCGAEVGTYHSITCHMAEFREVDERADQVVHEVPVVTAELANAYQARAALDPARADAFAKGGYTGTPYREDKSSYDLISTAERGLIPYSAPLVREHVGGDPAKLVPIGGGATDDFTTLHHIVDPHETKSIVVENITNLEVIVHSPGRVAVALEPGKTMTVDPLTDEERAAAKRQRKMDAWMAAAQAMQGMPKSVVDELTKAMRSEALPVDGVVQLKFGVGVTSFTESEIAEGQNFITRWINQYGNGGLDEDGYDMVGALYGAGYAPNLDAAEALANLCQERRSQALAPIERDITKAWWAMGGQARTASYDGKTTNMGEYPLTYGQARYWPGFEERRAPPETNYACTQCTDGSLVTYEGVRWAFDKSWSRWWTCDALRNVTLERDPRGYDVLSNSECRWVASKEALANGYRAMMDRETARVMLNGNEPLPRCKCPRCQAARELEAKLKRPGDMSVAELTEQVELLERRNAQLIRNNAFLTDQGKAQAKTIAALEKQNTELLAGINRKHQKYADTIRMLQKDRAALEAKLERSPVILSVSDLQPQVKQDPSSLAELIEEVKVLQAAAARGAGTRDLVAEVMKSVAALIETITGLTYRVGKLEAANEPNPGSHTLSATPPPSPSSYAAARDKQSWLDEVFGKAPKTAINEWGV